MGFPEAISEGGTAMITVFCATPPTNVSTLSASRFRRPMSRYKDVSTSLDRLLPQVKILGTLAKRLQVIILLQEAVKSLVMSDPWSQPALTPPPGVIPNFVDPPSRGYWVIVTMVICLSLSTIFVLIRMYTRLYIIKPLGLDDYTCLCAWLGFIGYAGIEFEALRYGSEVDQWNIPVASAVHWAQLAVDTEILYSVLIFITKLSILLLYLRIFVPHRAQKGRIYVIIHLTIWINLLFYIANIFVEIFQCTPRQKAWIPTYSGHCVDIYALMFTTAVVNVISDITILLLPILTVWNLQMILKQKILLSLVFSLGLLAVISSIIHLILSVHGARSSNQTVVLIDTSLLMAAELTSGIVVGCMPIVPTFFRYLFGKAQTRHTSAHRLVETIHSKKGSSANRDRKHGTHHRFPGQKAICSDKRRDPEYPYLHRYNCTELDDRANKYDHGSTFAHGTMTTIQGGKKETLSSVQEPEETTGKGGNVAFVQWTVDVNSCPRNTGPETPSL